MKYEYRYLIEIQYLGFRYNGWAKQKDLKTVHLMIDKSLEFTLSTNTFKTMGASRTDKMVSAQQSFFQLFLNQLISQNFIVDFNKNLPPDIKAIGCKRVSREFDILGSKRKTYHYVFAYNEKPHPFAASLITTLPEPLDIELMKKGAKLFEGTYNFKKYCTKPGPNTNLVRTIDLCEIIENQLYKANFFPKQSWILNIISVGFLRNQVRLIMGQLLELGAGRTTLKDIEISLINPTKKPLDSIAPPSGLILYKNELT